MWDTTLMAGGGLTQTSPFDSSQWTVTTGKQNSAAGGARTGQPSIMDALTPVATATYGAGGSKASAAGGMGMLPLLLIGGALVLVVVLKHKHKG
jgi:hypothetical protein